MADPRFLVWGTINYYNNTELQIPSDRFSSLYSVFELKYLFLIIFLRNFIIYQKWITLKKIILTFAECFVFIKSHLLTYYEEKIQLLLKKKNKTLCTITFSQEFISYTLHQKYFSYFYDLKMSIERRDDLNLYDL